MTILDQVKMILEDSNRTDVKKYDEITTVCEPIDYFEEIQGDSPESFRRKKEQGLKQLWHMSSIFFILHAIKPEDWESIKSYTLVFALDYLASPETKVVEMQGWRDYQIKCWDFTDALAKSGKYPWEQVATWFEMGR
jgi:hypothetical protein